jgi:hypothetical protein
MRGTAVCGCPARHGRGLRCTIPIEHRSERGTEQARAPASRLNRESSCAQSRPCRVATAHDATVAPRPLCGDHPVEHIIEGTLRIARVDRRSRRPAAPGRWRRLAARFAGPSVDRAAGAQRHDALYAGPAAVTASHRVVSAGKYFKLKIIAVALSSRLSAGYCSVTRDCPAASRAADARGASAPQYRVRCRTRPGRGGAYSRGT